MINAPIQYIESLPSKNIRDKTVDAFDIWFNVPAKDIAKIKQVVGICHNASLMLDDVEDGSNSRRGWPATHLVFGVAQTINSAGFHIIQAVEAVRALEDPACMDVFLCERPIHP